MNTYQPLDCDLHDYLEIACMHRYRLDIELTDGRRFQADALTTRTSAEKEEFFCLRGDEGPVEVRLDHLQAITPVNPNASFGRVELANMVCKI